MNLILEDICGKTLKLEDLPKAIFKIVVRDKTVFGKLRTIAYFDKGSECWELHYLYEWLRLRESTLNELAIICHELNRRLTNDEV